MATNISVSAPSVTNVFGNSALSWSVSCANSALQISAITFGSGSTQALTGPSGATAIMIFPPQTNVVQLTLKGVSGDTGIPISPSQPTGPIPFFSNSGTNTINLTSASAITGVVSIVWL